MTDRMTVLTIVGTRPEIIKLSRVIAELDEHTRHVLVHTGQNYDYELNEVFFEDLSIRPPDHFLEAAGETAAETIGQVISRADQVLAKTKPDAVLVLGDTNSCLAVIAAKRRKIPVFHMEAGNRCFDMRVPEEINRKIVDHTSDVNLVYTEHARRHLLAEGLKPETIFKTGSPMREVLLHHRKGIESSPVLDDLALRERGFFLVSAHREETVDEERQLRRLLDALQAIIETYDMPVIFSTHPRTQKRLEALHNGPSLDDRIRFLKPLGFLDYVKLETRAACVVSDSGTITEEASILGFPAVTTREAHERPEGMDEGTIIMCGLGRERILQAIEIVMAHAQGGQERFRVVSDYEPENVSLKVLRIIASYFDYVNRTTWYRS
jgi:UDP-N-acetylglucosamine 2-epimerase (non-hydrolysing)